MSILIKGMEMPKNCYECYFCTYGYCSNLNRYVENSQERDSDCPLIHIPPHGRLIDADAFLQEFTPTKDDEDTGAKLLLAIFCQIVKDAPTVLEAEGIADEQN